MNNLKIKTTFLVLILSSLFISACGKKPETNQTNNEPLYTISLICNNTVIVDNVS